MKKLPFDRANDVGLSQIRSWLNDGIQEGNEWVAINPTRNDNHKGSFRINLTTGQWLDFADDNAKGKDPVSLYAYLNYNRFHNLALQKNYKNIGGGIQAEAAKEILETYDPLYFPNENDNFFPKKEKRNSGDYWDSFHCIEKGLKENIPKLDVKFFEDKFGKEVERWFFIKNDFTVMSAVRFIKNGNKEDRPFTIWTDGKEYKWRMKALTEKYPLWNQDELKERENDKVLLTEGQKAASRMKDVLNNYVCVGFYGGCNAIDKQDWSVLRGREVWYTFDADYSGRKTIKKMQEIANEFDIKLHIVYPPLGVKKGWDIANTIEKGWNEEKLNEYLQNEREKFIDDEKAFTFDILGFSGEYIAFYSHGARKVVKHKATGITKSVMMSLMDRNDWANFYRTDNGIAWDEAANDILRKAEKKPVFDAQRIRGVGVWDDNGQIIINTGEKLIVNGEERELYETNGYFVYERGITSPFIIDEKISKDDLRKLFEICNYFDWKKEIYGKILAGWLLLAPFGSALRWRPHIWLTGSHGSGKSWLLENLCYPLIAQEFGIMGYGSSTPAGVRDALANNGKLTIMDEMESDNPKFAEYIDQNLKMFREGASGRGSGPATLHGTQDGEGRRWIVQSMAMMSSIGAAIKHNADKSRFTIIELGKNDLLQSIAEKEERFEHLKNMISIINNMLGRVFISRTYNLFDEVIKTIEVMTAQASDIFENRRSGDQIGTLMAGAWMFEHDEHPTAGKAKNYLIENGIESLKEINIYKKDEELCLDEILSTQIDIGDGPERIRATIASALTYWYETEVEHKIIQKIIPANIEIGIIKFALEQHGIKPVIWKDQAKIQIAASHTAIRKILYNTAWPSIYEDMLDRLPYCKPGLSGPTKFAGIAKRFKELDAFTLFDSIPF